MMTLLPTPMDESEEEVLYASELKQQAVLLKPSDACSRDGGVGGGDVCTDVSVTVTLPPFESSGGRRGGRRGGAVADRTNDDGSTKEFCFSQATCLGWRGAKVTWAISASRL